MNVLCNSSPLIGLARIDQLDILQKCFGEIIIPRAVWQEIVVEEIALELPESNMHRG